MLTQIRYIDNRSAIVPCRKIALTIKYYQPIPEYLDFLITFPFRFDMYSLLHAAKRIEEPKILCKCYRHHHGYA